MAITGVNELVDKATGNTVIPMRYIIIFLGFD
jgi:hypothetical protein